MPSKRVCTVVKDIMHVGTILSPGTEASDVELAQLHLLGQLNVMAEVTVVPLVVKGGNENNENTPYKQKKLMKTF